MTNAARLLRNPALRIMVVGYPGTAKTGSLVSLLNAGFKIRMLDYDGNIEPLLYYADKEKLKNLDVVYLEDKMRLGSQFSEPAGLPTALQDGRKLLDEWKYTEEDGTEVNLGKPSEWGPDTIVVLDSLTKLGDAAFRRAMKILNKTPANTTDRVWGLAMQEQAAFIEKLASRNNKYHVIVLAHLKMIAPADVRAGDSNLTEKIKEAMADIVPTRLYPSALGRQLPQNIGAEFPILLEAEKVTKGGKTTRTLNLEPKTLVDIKFPGDYPKGESRLDIKDGMLRVFEALSPGSVALVKENQH
jgi:hypothetical protein